MLRARRVLVIALVLAGVIEARQVPVQDRQPAGSALRPMVSGPNGGVCTGHPLRTAAAFQILLKGGNAFDAGVASLIAGGSCAGTASEGRRAGPGALEPRRAPNLR